MKKRKEKKKKKKMRKKDRKRGYREERGERREERGGRREERGERREEREQKNGCENVRSNFQILTGEEEESGNGGTGVNAIKPFTSLLTLLTKELEHLLLAGLCSLNRNIRRGWKSLLETSIGSLRQ